VNDSEKRKFGLSARKDSSSPWWTKNPCWTWEPVKALEAATVIRAVEEVGSTSHHCAVGHLTSDPTRFLVEKWGAPAVEESSIRNQVHSRFWAWKRGAIRCGSLLSSPDAEIVCFDKEDLEAFQQIMMPLAREMQQQSDLFVLTRADPKSALCLSSVTVSQIAKTVERLNYTDHVLTQYDAVKQDLNCMQPKGRLTLLEGPPGSGKTYLLRGLLAETSMSYVFVNAKNYDDLMDPELLQLFQEYFAHSSKLPIVLLLEDADKLLVPRQKGASLAGLSSALNLGDGLLAEIFDIRLVATTNAELIAIDPALLRKGRLSERIRVDLLSAAHANKVLCSLLQDGEQKLASKYFQTEEKDKLVISLADVYARARELGWQPPPRERKKKLFLRGPSTPEDDYA
jgi:energy-coupling factor transporter ATP-binding protein EcfA2